jgi:hypothetical protein
MNPSKTAATDHHMQQDQHAADELQVIGSRTLRDLLLRGISVIGGKIFLADDCRARKQGWQIIPRHGGFSRTYRDPRFDLLAACTKCNGRGQNPHGITCPDCHGIGRVFLAPDIISEPGQGQS